MSRAWLALGSNLGDRDGYLARARAALAQAAIRVTRESRVAETAPVGVIDQPAFLNQVLEVEIETMICPIVFRNRGTGAQQAFRLGIVIHGARRR